MFTGIIEAIGKVIAIKEEGSNVNFTLSCPFTEELKVDQSLAHDGCCLTVMDILENGEYRVDAIKETLIKTKLSDWEVGTEVNLERCVKIGGRLDGHMVQGHVDQVGRVENIEAMDGSYLIDISYEPTDEFITVPQGSITINGISLTVARSRENGFSVAIIPYTWEHTNMKNISIGQKVNLEFDMIGKYVTKLIAKSNAGN